MKRMLIVALLIAGVLSAKVVSVGETFVPNEPAEPSTPPAPEPEPEPEPEDSVSPSIGPFGSSEVGMEPAGSDAEPETYSEGSSGSPSGSPAASEETPAPCIAGFALLALAAFALKG